MGKLKKLGSAARILRTKNRYLLADTRRPAKRDVVNLDWWSPLDGSVNNLGDYLSPVVVDWMLGRRGISRDDSVRGTKFLAAVGSVLGFGINDSTVWGSGFLLESYAPFVRPALKKLDIRAVRGPRTAESLRRRGYSCPDVFGDPAILMPLIYAPDTPYEPVAPLLVSHMHDLALFEGDVFNMQTEDYKSYVDALRGATRVVSTSLHGLILAECYGVPAVLLASERDNFSLFKYEDWYLSTGRSSFPVATSVQEALKADPPELPHLDDLREGLLESFPYDLWEA